MVGEVAGVLVVVAGGDDDLVVVIGQGGDIDRAVVAVHRVIEHDAERGLRDDVHIVIGGIARPVDGNHPSLTVIIHLRHVVRSWRGYKVGAVMSMFKVNRRCVLVPTIYIEEQ